MHGLVAGEEWFSLDPSTSLILTADHGSLDMSELILELDDFLQGMRTQYYYCTQLIMNPIQTCPLVSR